MKRIILTYKLKAGVDPAAFEEWVRTTDYPAMRGLKRVKSFVNNRARRNLLTGGPASADYVEIFELDDLDGFVAEDMPGETVQRIMGEFMAKVDQPEFMVVEEVG